MACSRAWFSRRLRAVSKLKLVLVEAASPGSRRSAGVSTNIGNACAAKCRISNARRRIHSRKHLVHDATDGRTRTPEDLRSSSIGSAGPAAVLNRLPTGISTIRKRVQRADDAGTRRISSAKTRRACTGCLAWPTVRRREAGRNRAGTSKLVNVDGKEIACSMSAAFYALLSKCPHKGGVVQR